MHCGSYFYGSMDCFGRRQPLHDSIMRGRRRRPRKPFLPDSTFPAAIAGLFHFRCDASLITEYRPYAATLVLNCVFDPMYNITVLTEIKYRLVVFHYELHL